MGLHVRSHNHQFPDRSSGNFSKKLIIIGTIFVWHHSTPSNDGRFQQVNNKRSDNERRTTTTAEASDRPSCGDLQRLQGTRPTARRSAFGVHTHGLHHMLPSARRPNLPLLSSTLCSGSTRAGQAPEATPPPPTPRPQLARPVVRTCRPDASATPAHGTSVGRGDRGGTEFQSTANRGHPGG